MANELLPNNDRDLLLAKQLGEVLDRGGDFAVIEDPILEPLIDYKNQTLSNIAMDNSIADKIWKEIEKESILLKPAKVTPLFRRPAAIAWASAAAILIAAFVGFYWLNSSSQVQMVAQSSTEIENVVLEDGTEVTLRPNSTLYQISYSETERSYQLEGEAYFNVTRNEHAPFSIDAEYGTVTVLGTQFNVSTWGGKTIVYLDEGSVEVSTPDQTSSLILEPGQASEISNGIISLTESPQANKFTDWISNSIVFYGNSPEEVVAELNQHFGVSINIENLENRSGLNGTLQLESISQTLDDLGLVLGGTFLQRSTTQYEFIPME